MIAELVRDWSTPAGQELVQLKKIRQPVIAIGGVKGLGANVGTMVRLVAENVEAVTLEDCGHFVPEESPDEIVQRVLKIVRKTQR